MPLSYFSNFPNALRDSAHLTLLFKPEIALLLTYITVANLGSGIYNLHRFCKLLLRKYRRYFGQNRMVKNIIVDIGLSLHRDFLKEKLQRNP